MTDAPPHATRNVWVARNKENALILISERASFAISPCLKQLGNALIDRQCKRIVFDMADCSGVDSTFLGTLAGLASRMSKHPENKIIMINLVPSIYENVCTLGLNRIVDCYEVGKCPVDVFEQMGQLGSMDRMEVDRLISQKAREMAIEAHETLINTDDSNYPRFKDALTFLRESSDAG